MMLISLPTASRTASMLAMSSARRSRPRHSLRPWKPPSLRNSTASFATSAGDLSQRPLLLYAGRGPMLPPSSTRSGTPAALASASQAGHVEPGKRDHRHPLIADEMQRLAGSFVKVDRSEPAAFEQFAEIVKR